MPRHRRSEVWSGESRRREESELSCPMPIFYECDRCTACCRWPGQVSLPPEQITGIAAFLGLVEADFIDRFTRLNRERTGLALKDQADGACIFLEGGACRIQPVKPQQCRDFPNLWNFPGFQAECRARPVEVTAEEWKRRIYAATGREAASPP